MPELEKPTIDDMFYYTLNGDGETVTITMRTSEALDALRHSGKNWLARAGAVLIPGGFNPMTTEQQAEYSSAYAEWGGGLLEIADAIECEQIQRRMGITPDPDQK